MFRVTPGNPDSVQYAEKFRHNYMVNYNPNYMFTFGGGHDYMCNSAGNAYSNMDHDYDTPYVKSGKTPNRMGSVFGLVSFATCTPCHKPHVGPRCMWRTKRSRLDRQTTVSF